MIEQLEQYNLEDRAWMGMLMFGAFGAFSRATIRKIRERDEDCVVGGGCRGSLQAAHVDHSRTSRDYNQSENGKLLCIEHHLQDHIVREGQNGLNLEDNGKAINSLRTQLEMYV